MDVYEALYTTRAMRRVRPDPIPYEVQARILDAAIRAPSGGNAQGWRFMLVDDPAVKGRLGPLYRDSIRQLWATAYHDRLEQARQAPDEPAHASLLRVTASAQHLADHFEQVPLFMIGFSRGDPTGGSIFPAVWSAQLAARASQAGSSESWFDQRSKSVFFSRARLRLIWTAMAVVPGWGAAAAPSANQ